MYNFIYGAVLYAEDRSGYVEVNEDETTKFSQLDTVEICLNRQTQKKRLKVYFTDKAETAEARVILLLTDNLQERRKYTPRSPE